MNTPKDTLAYYLKPAREAKTRTDRAQEQIEAFTEGFNNNVLEAADLAQAPDVSLSHKKALISEHEINEKIFPPIAAFIDRGNFLSAHQRLLALNKQRKEEGKRGFTVLDVVSSDGLKQGLDYLLRSSLDFTAFARQVGGLRSLCKTAIDDLPYFEIDAPYQFQFHVKSDRNIKEMGAGTKRKAPPHAVAKQIAKLHWILDLDDYVEGIEDPAYRIPLVVYAKLTQGIFKYRPEAIEYVEKLCRNIANNPERGDSRDTFLRFLTEWLTGRPSKVDVNRAAWDEKLAKQIVEFFRLRNIEIPKVEIVDKKLQSDFDAIRRKTLATIYAALYEENDPSKAASELYNLDKEMSGYASIHPEVDYDFEEITAEATKMAYEYFQEKLYEELSNAVGEGKERVGQKLRELYDELALHFKLPAQLPPPREISIFTFLLKTGEAVPKPLWLNFNLNPEFVQEKLAKALRSALMSGRSNLALDIIENYDLAEGGHGNVLKSVIVECEELGRTEEVEWVREMYLGFN